LWFNVIDLKQTLAAKLEGQRVVRRFGYS
jgi:hypothetical protein